jgi:nucleoside-diphosphate-sugar epimerase
VTGGLLAAPILPCTTIPPDRSEHDAAHAKRPLKFVAIGNLFAYATDVPSPIREKDLFNGLPTDSHRGVGWMKRNLALLADLNFRQYAFPMVVVYSANAYGPRDSLDRQHAHVIPSTTMKCLSQKELVVWGDGTPTRDFLFAEDVAAGLVLAAERLAPPGYVNIGSGAEISVRELVDLIVRFTKFAGPVTYDASKGGGDARRCSSVEQARALSALNRHTTCVAASRDRAMVCRTSGHDDGDATPFEFVNQIEPWIDENEVRHDGDISVQVGG